MVDETDSGQVSADQDIAQAALAEIRPYIKPEKTQEVRTVLTRIVSKHHSGPIPPAEEMRDLEAVHPGFANRILEMAEKEQAHRHTVQTSIINGDIGLKRRGQAFALVALTLMLSAVAYIAYLGNAVAAVSLGTATLICVVALFITGRKYDLQETKPDAPTPTIPQRSDTKNKRRSKR